METIFDYDQYKRCKNAALSHSYYFHEWDLFFKNVYAHLYTGKTARKTLSAVPFAKTFIGSEQDYIMEYARLIFPKYIWVGTKKQQNNTTKVFFTNTYDNNYGKFISAFDLGTSRDKTNKILNGIGTANAAMTLCSFSEDDCCRKYIYGVNAIAVKVDYKSNGFYGKKGKRQVLDILEKEHFGKTMPAPTFIIDEDMLVLVFVFEEPAYVFKHKKGIEFFEWMSSVFAGRISYLGGIPVKANEPVLLPETAVCHGRDRVVRCTAKWILHSNLKINHRTLREWLPTMEEVKETLPWYKTQIELEEQKKLRKKEGKQICSKWDPNFTENNKNVLEDLVTIRNYYITNNITWHFKTLLFIYCVYAKKVIDKDLLYDAICKFAAPFRKNISDQAFRSVIECSSEKDYKYKNKTILTRLGISEENELGLKICEASKNRKNYRSEWKQKKQASRAKEKENKKDNLLSLIVKFRNKGMKNLEIVNKLLKEGFSLSFKTLERYITELIKDKKLVSRIA